MDEVLAAIRQLGEQFERLERRVEDHWVAFEDRLASVESRLVGMTDGLVALGGRLTGLELEVRDLRARLEALTPGIVRARTQDIGRFGDHEQRLRALEARFSIEHKGEKQ